MWTTIRVSASSWLQFGMRISEQMDATAFSDVTYTALSGGLLNSATLVGWQCIKRESGQQAYKHSRWFLLHRISVGAKWRTHGFQCGLQFQRFRDYAGKCWNAPAKETAQTAHVAKRIWIAHHYVNVAVANKGVVFWLYSSKRHNRTISHPLQDSLTSVPLPGICI